MDPMYVVMQTISHTMGLVNLFLNVKAVSLAPFNSKQASRSMASPMVGKEPESIHHRA